MSDALIVDALTVVRGERRFPCVSFVAQPGAAVLVTGANGVGKSSLLRALAGLGRIASGGVDRPAGGHALMEEAPALDRTLTLRRALLFWARLDPLSTWTAVATPAVAGGAAARVDAALAQVALAGLGDVPVRLLSAGQRRRAALARVVASGARLWLLDEPGNALDTAALDRLAVVVSRHRDAGGIVVAATHQPLDWGDVQAVRL